MRATDPRALTCRNALALALSAVSVCGILAFGIHALFVSHKPPTGDPGLSGATGATGAAGATGATGPPGQRGATGNTGATGSVGAPGPPGGQGPAGHSCWDRYGSDGLCNVTTEDANHDTRCTPADCLGPQGVLGPTGTHGPTGPTGPTGAAGGIRCWDSSGVATSCNPSLFDVNGDGACNVADCAATTCNPQNNVTACVGPIGITGATGPRGPTGPTGPTSLVTGATGATGYACWDRNQNGVFDVATEDTDGDGQASSRDCIGPRGVNGVNGINGVNGNNGAMGSAGAAGPTGTTGGTGDKGSAGSLCWDLNNNGVCDGSTEDTDWSTSPNGCNLEDCVSGDGRGIKRRYPLTLPLCSLTSNLVVVRTNQTYTVEHRTALFIRVTAVFSFHFSGTAYNQAGDGNANHFRVGGCNVPDLCAGYDPIYCGTGGWPADILVNRSYPQVYVCTTPRIVRVVTGGNMTMFSHRLEHYGVPFGSWWLGFYSTTSPQGSMFFDFYGLFECTMWISRQLTP